MSVLNTDHSSPSPTTLPPPVPVTATPSHHLHLLQPHQPLTHRGLAHPQDANLGLGEDPTRVFFRYRPLPSAASSEPRAQPTRAQCQVTNHSPATSNTAQPASVSATDSALLPQHSSPTAPHTDLSVQPCDNHHRLQLLQHPSTSLSQGAPSPRDQPRPASSTATEQPSPASIILVP